MAYENEADYPANVKAELLKMRDGSTSIGKAIEGYKAKISDNDILNFDIRNAKIIDEKTGKVVNPGDVKKAMSDTANLSTSDKVKNFASANKWWIVGGLVVVVVVGVGLFMYFIKRRS